MTLSRRLTLLIVSVLLLALLGSLAIHSLGARDVLQRELEVRNRDAAASLALALSQQGGDAAAMQTLAAAQFDLGHYRRISLRTGGGQTAFDLQKIPQPQAAPAWFAAALPIDAEAGRALVSDGWRAVGTLQVESETGWAQEALWQALSHTALLLTALSVAAALLVFAALQAWLQPLQRTVAQAFALAQGRFVEAPEPRLPELRDLTQSMNALVRRMRELFAAQADQVALLQRQAQQDPVTALPLRSHFLARLQHRLADPGGPGVALILVRVLKLDALNPRLGHDATDQVLRAVADVLLTYVDRVPGTFAGRLNGGDFALCLPVAGIAGETEAALRTTLAASPALRSSNVEVAVGSADSLHGLGSGPALAAADAALAHAEASADAAVVAPSAAQPESTADPAGSRTWRAQIGTALAEERFRIAEFRVVGRDGGLIHLECPLRVQLRPGGEYQAAAHWLALAHRSRLLPQVDLAALSLALAAISADGQARSVHAALASIADPDFIAEVARRLRAAPAAAARLSIECVEGLRPGEFAPLANAAAAWRGFGIRLGVEHAGAAPQQLPGLHGVGVDYVKVEARHLRGAATQPGVKDYAQSLVALIHGLSMSALAEGVDDAADLAALWALGFDGATGPAVG
ncbi:MAG: EAL domain-containing protein [Pseudomonadota bacterium]|nr:EAL domain-containing protein [Pseudomonadota bacterium]